jgi:integrase
MQNFPPYPRVPHPNGGQARIRLNGKQVYLGKFQSPESIVRYDQLRDDWLRRKSVDRSTLTIDELAIRFLEYAIDYYVKDGKPTSEVACIRAALRPLVELYGPTLAAAFGPLALKGVRDEMIRRGWKRKAINRQVQRIQRAFRWGVENELLPEAVHRALTALSGLSRGRTPAVEGEPVQPVPIDSVDAIRRHVSRHVWAMIQLQLLTGARPGEIVSMRVGDLNTSGQTWEYVPRSHKSQHWGRDRSILIGPKAQAILREFLRPNVDAFVFSPTEADCERQSKRRTDRRSPMTPSQAARQPTSDARRRPKDRYSVSSYRRAIERACEVAFGMPDDLRTISNSMTAEEKCRRRAAAADWRRAYCWHPHQLRHTAATELRRAYGIEAARIILGHASLDATEIYAEADLQRARQIAIEVG